MNDMKKLIASLLVMFCLIGCSQKKENSLPAPVSKGDLQKLIAGKTFTVSRIGTISPLAEY